MQVVSSAVDSIVATDLPEQTQSVSRADEAARRFRFRVPAYYQELIDVTNPDDSLAKMVMPSGSELDDAPHLKLDSFDEQEQMPVPGLIRRYRDRALILMTGQCAVHCRFCTRKWYVAQDHPMIAEADFERILCYLGDHPELRDIILSGGDPLMIADAILAQYLRRLRQLTSVKFIRIGTRIPVVRPDRVTDRLAHLLSGVNPLFIQNHFNHPRELTRASCQALTRMADQGLVLSNHTVLLHRINDQIDTLEALFVGLLEMRVRPYYLFQCDLVAGNEQFRTPLEKGLDLMDELRERLGGLALPRFVIDLPGQGKLQLSRNDILRRDGRYLVVATPKGEFRYPDVVP